jgi:murein DD-endopeptidase MepM/ murein hydrolase activator NlpD
MPSGVSRRLRVVAGLLALGILPVSVVLTPYPVEAVQAADYPSWEEVVAAQRNTAQAKELAAQLQSQLQGLQDEAQRTQSEADAKGAIYAAAQDAYDQQNVETQALLDQTAAAKTAADEAYLAAAQVISEITRTGTRDITPRLFTAPGSPDVLLDRLEISRVLGERYSDLYDTAVELRNTADALADQAEVAQGILETLRVAAETAFEEAQAAAEAAAAMLAQTQKDIAEVQARIDYLVGVSTATTAAYNEGLKAMWGDNAEGEISQSGWARPVAGYISSNFGMRVNPVSHVWQLHTGVDLAGQGCGATIRAAHAGTVTYAGWNGSWGYYVAIDHHDGTGTGYAHIGAGQIGVHIGQDVSPGQPIAKVGSTGQSTGCHLHFIVRVNGNRDLTDPVPFMRNQGITLG